MYINALLSAGKYQLFFFFFCKIFRRARPRRGSFSRPRLLFTEQKRPALRAGRMCAYRFTHRLISACGLLLFGLFFCVVPDRRREVESSEGESHYF